MIVTTKQLFRHAYGKYAVGAYNINNLEQTVGLFRGNLGGRSRTTTRPTPRKVPPSSCRFRAGPEATATSVFSKR